VTPQDQLRAVLVAYVNGGDFALDHIVGDDPVPADVFKEAVRTIGANRRALVTGRRPRSGVDRWDRRAFDQEEARDEARREQRGGNL
jgi:hypothetical protein